MKARLAVAALSLSAAGFVALVAHEDYTDRAVVPIPGDRPTVGFGSTFRDDGSPVQMGDTITPPRAVARTFAHIERDETRLRQCVTAPLHQHEYDALVDHAYQFGAAATCGSTVVRRVNAGDYTGACDAYLMWKRAAGRDCSVRSNGCYGVWLRAQERRARCLGN